MGVSAAGWMFVAIAYFASWLPEAEAGGPSYASSALWYGFNYFLWFLFTPLVLALTTRFPVTAGETRKNLPIHVAAALVLAMTHVVVFLNVDFAIDPQFALRYGNPVHPLQTAFKNNFMFRTLTGVVTYGVVVGLFTADATWRRMRQDERRNEALKRQLAEAELQALRMQIQPHFLFNTLHSISSLIHEQPSEALAMVARLGDFLRATLERGATETLPLEDEVRFAELYLEIEKVRFGDRLRVSIDVAPETRGLEAPSLILQPLVENAVRHGVAPSVGAVDFSIAAVKRDGELEITLVNAPRGKTKGNGKSNGAGGLGLANTRARLERMYGARASLSCETPKPGAFTAIVRIPATDARHGG